MAIPDVVEWAESPAGFYLADTRAPIKLAPHQGEILRHVLTPGQDGRLPYDTAVYACPKKSGKTTVAALVAEYFALFIEAPNEIYSVANSLEQSQGRSYKALGQSIRLNRILASRTDVQNKVIHFDNGTDVVALSSDYAGAAGSNHGLTVWDELWAYIGEASWRLWDELTPVPTKKISLRFVVTYAGFSGESKLLEGLYQRGQEGEVIPELAHIGNGEGLPACRASGRTFVYWDHELKAHPGLTVTPQAYHAEQRGDLRPLAFLRLHENRFTSNESAFITPDQWAACESPQVRPLSAGERRRVVLGADASTTRDLTALVGCSYDQAGDLVDQVYCKVWKPQRGILRLGKPTIDLEGIKAEILRIHKDHNLVAVYFDPFQLHQLGIDLEKAGVRMIELPQTSRRVEADQALYDAIVAKSVRHYGDQILTDHITNAVAIESPRGYRIAKEKTSLKIDAAVALSMAHFGALEQLKAIGEATSIPNIFYDWSNPDGSVGSLSDHQLAGGAWLYLPDRNRRPHPPGVTWQTCRYRNKGCDACAQELTDEGWFEQAKWDKNTIHSTESVRERIYGQDYLEREKEFKKNVENHLSVVRLWAAKRKRKLEG